MEAAVLRLNIRSLHLCYWKAILFSETSVLAMAEKGKLRACDDFDSLNAVSEVENASVHGVIASLSPMKKGKGADFFDAKLTDGDTNVRVVGFQASQRKRLASFYDTSASVSLQNCKVKRARNSEDFEILLKSTSRMEPSNRKFSIDDIANIGAPFITLDQLDERKIFDNVCLEAKVIRVDEPVKVAGEKKKQQVIVADSTAAARLYLWEGDVGRLISGQSYKFKNIVIQSYQESKFLSIPREGATIAEIDDIGEVGEDDTADETSTVYAAEVVAVLMLESYLACLVCKSKVEKTEENLGYCTKCNVEQRIDVCKKQLSARLLISAADTYITLNGFGNNIQEIVGAEEVTAKALMTARPFTLTHANNVITSISRV